MRQKLREIPCLDEAGREAVVIEWGFADPCRKGIYCRELRMEDGSPVNKLGAEYEHFYSGRMLRPV